MSFGPSGFNANDHEPNDFSPLPAGEYVAAIIESVEKPTRAGTGSYHSLTFQILEGEYKGRQLWTNLNLNNPSRMAVKIASGELSEICRAVNVMHINAMLELHNLPMTITVKLEKRRDTDELKNVIKGYKPRESAAAPAAVPGSTPAWKRP
jgi:hypothetical protein